MHTGRKRPRVTVLMAVYNEAPYVGQAVRSVLNQDYREVELIVIDDASADETARVVAGFQDQRVKLLRLSQNQGKAAAMNQGLEAARGTYVLELDGDDWLDSDALAVLAAAMDAMPRKVAMIYGNRRGVVEDARGNLRQTFVLHGRPYRDRLDFIQNPHPPGPRFYRTRALRAVGGWPVDYSGNGRLYEDVVLILKLLDRYEIGYVDCSVYNMRCHGQNISQAHIDQWWSIVGPVMNESLQRWGEPYTAAYDAEKRCIELVPRGEENR